MGILGSVFGLFSDKNERKTANADNRQNQLIEFLNAVIANERYKTNREDSTFDWLNASADVANERAITDALLERFIGEMTGAKSANGDRTYYDPETNQWVTEISDATRDQEAAMQDDEARRLQSRQDAMRRQEADAQDAGARISGYEDELARSGPSADVIAALMKRQNNETIGKQFSDARNSAALQLSRTGGDPSKAYAALAGEQARTRADANAAAELQGLMGAEQLQASKASRLTPIINSLAARRTQGGTLGATANTAGARADANAAQAQQAGAQRGSLGVSALAARKIATPRLNTGYQGTGVVDMNPNASTVSKAKEINGIGNIISGAASLFL